MLALNIWGNMLIERMDDIKECEYKGYAQSFQMLFLISTYCVIFVYVIFLLTIKETLKRYYIFMDRTQEELNQRINIRGMRVNLVRGRSYRDWCDALAYSLYLIHKGKIGSRQEREYIDAERAARNYRRLASSIKEFRFDEDDDDEEITSEADLKLDKCKSAPDGSSFNPIGNKFAINDDQEVGASPLLNQSNSSGLQRSNSMTSIGSNSVTPRGNGKNTFKYKCCSICLADFSAGEMVKVIPGCGHTFHGDCLEQWLVREFRCPNCN